MSAANQDDADRQAVMPRPAQLLSH